MEAMFNGELINETEHRAVLHTALRNFSRQSRDHGRPGCNAGIQRVLAQMRTFCDKIHSGEWKGYTGKRIKYIVNIGIGGSDLGAGDGN